MPQQLPARCRCPEPASSGAGSAPAWAASGVGSVFTPEPWQALGVTPTSGLEMGVHFVKAHPLTLPHVSPFRQASERGRVSILAESH